MSLRETIATLAAEFADGILRAVRNASLEDLLGGDAANHVQARAIGAGTKTRPRAVRRTPADVAQVIDGLVDVLRKQPLGLRSEELQRELRLTKKDLVRPITEALAAKRIRKTGQKRATTYFAA